jgi:DNA-binding IclR family transcriptional regulator
VFSGDGECVAAMSVAGPITRLPADRIDRVARMVLAAAARVSAPAPANRPLAS